MKDFPKARRDRPHLRALDALGEFHDAQTLVDKLPGEVDVGSIVEGDDHLRQAELGDRTHIFQARQPADRLFDRQGDLPFDLLGGERRSDGVDLNLGRGGVGEGVDVQTRQRKNAQAGQRQGDDDDQQTVPQ